MIVGVVRPRRFLEIKVNLTTLPVPSMMNTPPRPFIKARAFSKKLCFTPDGILSWSKARVKRYVSANARAFVNVPSINSGRRNGWE